MLRWSRGRFGGFGAFGLRLIQPNLLRSSTNCETPPGASPAAFTQCRALWTAPNAMSTIARSSASLQGNLAPQTGAATLSAVTKSAHTRASRRPCFWATQQHTSDLRISAAQTMSTAGDQPSCSNDRKSSLKSAGSIPISLSSSIGHPDSAEPRIDIATPAEKLDPLRFDDNRGSWSASKLFATVARNKWEIYLLSIDIPWSHAERTVHDRVATP